MIKLFRKRWMLFDQIVKTYKPFVTVDYGVISVSPNDIIGLSTPVNQVKNSDKMKELRNSLEQKGWHDECPVDLHLYRLPNGKYTVATDGNHRTYLANQLEIPKIKAMVSLLIPETYIPENIKAKIEEYEQKEKTYRLEAEKLSKSLQSLGEKRKKAKDEFAYKNFCKLIDDMYSKRQYMLLGFARFLNFVPNETAD
ncbi:hypothetical protein C2I17_00815 [Niallia circulans]|uniref:hypothetical protein n=1 Tax=Niallia circulans TaxID=1397 RepID=UPI00201E3965|nr:hypothetical protein [Niallia circulans]UQZ73218.1 hypothetical protein C2I17_00815 [Niallia circulans]